MAKRGGTLHQKRLAAPRPTLIARKAHIWLKAPGPGTHPKQRAVSLLVLIRDIMKLATDTREARLIIRGGKVLVDGKPRKVEDFPLGLMDVVDIPELKKAFSITIDPKERIIAKEIHQKDAKAKLVKVVRKVTAPGAKIQLGMHDGRSMLAGKEEVKVGDSLKLGFDGKMLGHLQLKTGATCLITKGKHAGEVAKVSELLPGTAVRAAEAKLVGPAGEFTTVKEYLFVIE